MNRTMPENYVENVVGLMREYISELADETMTNIIKMVADDAGVSVCTVRRIAEREGIISVKHIGNTGTRKCRKCCRHCATELPMNAKFCPECGKRVLQEYEIIVENLQNICPILGRVGSEESNEAVKTIQNATRYVKKIAEELEARAV